MDDQGYGLRTNPFFEMYETNNPYKWICLVYSVICMAAITPILYLVIQFQNENPYTTLVQQVFSSMLGVALSVNISVHIPFVLLYIFGPFSQLACDLLLNAQSVLIVQLLLLANVLMIIRYIFTFILKNPVAVQQGFWKIFIFIWTFLVAILTQTTFFLLPGNNPSQFYTCSGQIPINYNKLNNKVNYAFFIIAVFTLCCQPLLGLRIKLFNLKKGPTKLLMKETISETYDVLNISFQVIITLIFLINLTPLFKIVSLNLTSFQTYPAYLWMYLHHLFATQTLYLLSLAVLMKNSRLLTYVIRNFQEVLRLR